MTVFRWYWALNYKKKLIDRQLKNIFKFRKKQLRTHIKSFLTNLKIAKSVSKKMLKIIPFSLTDNNFTRFHHAISHWQVAYTRM